MRIVLSGLAAIALLCAFGVAHATDAPPAPAEPKAVALTRMVVEVPAGRLIGTVQKGFFCTTAATSTSNGAKAEFNVAPVQSAFRQEMHDAGLKTDDSGENLFEPQASGTGADFSLGGVISDRSFRICLPNTSGPDMAKAKGEESMTIDWQLYSRALNQVVGRYRTSATFEIKEPTTGGAALIINGVFAANVRQLAANPEFRAALSGGGPTAAAEAPIVLSGSLSAPGQAVEAAVDSVVLVTTSAEQGSAFLISRDGYLLTDAHVVGDSKAVRVRWSDGTEETADVVRVSKRVDAALLKADPRGHTPLPLRRDHPAVGETVYAIGSPLGQKFQGTVTRGVVSAERTENEHHYIQSDVVVQMGSSGGPLLDQGGRVVGVTEKGAGVLLPVSAGLNFFTPIGDVLDALSLRPQ